MSAAVSNTILNDSPELRTLLDQFLSDSSIAYFPVRHHSPACSYHLKRFIDQFEPDKILVEGPDEFNNLISFFSHPDTKAPFAVYSCFVDKENRLKMNQSEGGGSPLRFNSYYPFCEYSPELVALKEGASKKICTAFIDMPYGVQICSRNHDYNQTQLYQTKSLLNEVYFSRSKYIQSLVKKTGCRDHDDLWDHLFESKFTQMDTDEFRASIFSYCYYSRMDYTDELLEYDGCRAREVYMANNIVKELKKARNQKILVVTGGFHTKGLMDLLAKKSMLSSAKFPKVISEPPVPIRYSFNQLDALNGYVSGMPSPYYYQLFWDSLLNGSENPYYEASLLLLTGMETMGQSEDTGGLISSGDIITVLEQACRLADYRQHLGPTREDLLDGIRAGLVKGSMDIEGQLIMSSMLKQFSGNLVGEVADDYGSPPILTDFYAEMDKNRLEVSGAFDRSIALSIYKKKQDLNRSMLFHRLDYLGVSFATMLSGPDFIHGLGLERIVESWRYTWSPVTDSDVLENAVYGSTLYEACITLLELEVQELEKKGLGRNSFALVTVLLKSIGMGLDANSLNLSKQLMQRIPEDFYFHRVVKSLDVLFTLRVARKSLQSNDLDLRELCESLFQQSIRCMESLTDCPPDNIAVAMDAMVNMYSILKSDSDGLFDMEILVNELELLYKSNEVSSGISGAVLGLLFSEGRVSLEEVSAAVNMALKTVAFNAKERISFLEGVLKTNRHLLWVLPDFLEAVNSSVDELDDEDFVQNLPALRLIFASLTPSETDRVAQMVAEHNGAKGCDVIVNHQISESQMLLNQEVENIVWSNLINDNLGHWIE